MRELVVFNYITYILTNGEGRSSHNLTRRGGQGTGS